ncbi:glycosyltransferase family 2 protein [Crossiella sp. CA198]|uniref:glycosyltransferase family 2 protein n=1 Tax=Crossiella sp. CA198 TaxID=3455607 RepID=UPI003F8D7942
MRYRVRGGPGRKAANVQEFCAVWGADYDYLVVLDADSVMSGAALRQLVGLMDVNPAAGLIEVPGAPVGGRAVFARLQQFAAAVYGPISAWGNRVWQRGNANYHGHNAIIRIAPFRAHCRLPELPGGPPFGGEILSHDFVEAALLRRAGWEVWSAPELGGGYESAPPTIVEYARRDRRWCQGNLQHLRVITWPGRTVTSRLHLGRTVRGVPGVADRVAGAGAGRVAGRGRVVGGDRAAEQADLVAGHRTRAAARPGVAPGRRAPGGLPGQTCVLNQVSTACWNCGAEGCRLRSWPTPGAT